MSGKVKVTYQSSSSDEGEDDGNRADSEVEDVSEDSDNDAPGKNPLSSVMAKILQQKTTTKTTILAKGKTDHQILESKLKKQGTEDDSEEDAEEKDTGSKPTKHKRAEVEEGSDSDSSGDEIKKKKRKWEYMGRVKPNILHKDKERTLQKVATRGVVQLFNAVKQQQKELTDDLSKASSERAKDKVLQSVDKKKFMDVLKKGTKALNKDSSKGKSKEEPSWSILKDNFMMGAKMKDWDKDSDVESGVESS